MMTQSQEKRASNRLIENPYLPTPAPTLTSKLGEATSASASRTICHSNSMCFCQLRNDLCGAGELRCHALQNRMQFIKMATEAAIFSNAARWIRFALLACALGLPGLATASELKPEAAQGFERYVRLTEKRMREDLHPGGAFLWVDGLPELRRDSVHAQLQKGEVASARLKTTDPAGEIRTPGAMIHHWVGTVFIPGTSLRQALATVEDYDQDSMYYSPQITKSKTLEHGGDDFKVYLRLMSKKIVTVVLDTEYAVHYEQLDADRAQSQSYSTRIAQVAHPGESDEQQIPRGKDSGYLWRLNSYWRFYERDGGVYVQCEVVSLTRDIPAGLGWLISPFIESIPRESLGFMLRSTRAAVLGGISRASQ
jgi:hypothetical protein